MFGIGNDPFGQQIQDDPYASGDRLVNRVMSAQYNLAVQRNDAPTATGILARMLGQWLQTRFSR